MRRFVWCLFLAVLFGAGGLWAAQPVSLPAGGLFEGIQVDSARKQLVIRAEVCLTEGPLELLLCKSQTKDYESILRTNASPSAIHAALLAMGLAPGKPARTAVDSRTAATVLLPPRGPEMTVELRWVDRQGATHQVPAGQWLSVQEGRASLPQKWVFVGSDLTPEGAYWADESGDILSVANFAASVIDVPFDSTNKNEALFYRANVSAIPPKGTAVEVILGPLAGADRSPDARATVEIDPLGRFGIDGREYTGRQLTDWAQEYIARHARGEVTLRVDARALADDIRRAQECLRMGGVFDVNPVFLAPPQELLPRSAEQARESLAEWARRFERPGDFVGDPAQEAQALLEHIGRQGAQLDQLKVLWEDYRQSLLSAMNQYRAAATQPTSKESPLE